MAGDALDIEICIHLSEVFFCSRLIKNRQVTYE